jgi:hypothetical protein
MLASINIKLTIMMVSVVPLVGVAAVLLVGIYENILKSTVPSCRKSSSS